MVLISCLVTCSNTISTECKLSLSQKCCNDDICIGKYVVMDMVDGVKLPCRLMQSLPGHEASRLDVPHLFRAYVSEKTQLLELRELPFRLYKIPLVKSVVLSVPFSLQKQISPSGLKNKLNGHIISANLKIVSSGAQSGVYVPLLVKRLIGNCDINTHEEDDFMSMFKISRCHTQIFLEPEQSEFNEHIPRNLTSIVYTDTHSALRGLIISAFNQGINHHEDGITLNISRNTISSILLVGQSGSAKSQIVQEEAEAASVSVLRLMPASLLHLDESRVIVSLHSFFVSALLQQPCIILIEMLELFENAKYSSIMTHIVNALKNFLQYLSNHNSVSRNEFGKKLSVNRGMPRGAKVLVFGCTESTDGIDSSLLNAFEDTFCLPSSLSSSCENLLMEKMKGIAGVCGFNQNCVLLDKHHGLSLMDFVLKYQETLTDIACFDSDASSICNGNGEDSQLRPANDDPYVLSHDDIITGIQDILLIPRRFPSIYREYNIAPPTGILLYGPSGTGKTLLVKSIVKQIPGTFINIKISDVMSGSVGESSILIRNYFLQAKKQSPAVVFIDEFQALFSSRDIEKQNTSGSSDDSLIFTLIGCLDDIATWNSNAGPEFIVTVMAATNEPWAVDEILLRSGRFDKVMFVGPMSATSRRQLLLKFVGGIKNVPININFEDVIEKSNGFTGADMNILFQKACCLYSDRKMYSVNDGSRSSDANKLQHQDPIFNNSFFDKVLDSMASSCSPQESTDYTDWGKEFISKIW